MDSSSVVFPLGLPSCSSSWDWVASSIIFSSWISAWYLSIYLRVCIGMGLEADFNGVCDC